MESPWQPIFQPPLNKDGAKLPPNGKGSVKLIALFTVQPFASVATIMYRPANKLQISSELEANALGPVHV